MSKNLIYLTSIVLVLSMAGIASAELVAHWRLDDGSGTVAVDSSDNGHDGTLLLDPQWVAGKFGGALEFAGVSGQRVEMEGYEGILGTQNRSVMAWVKTTGFGDWISWGQNTNTQKWIGRINDNASNGAVGALRTECSGGYTISTTVVNDGEWHHLAAVLESAGSPTVENIRMYVDGVQEAISNVNPVAIDTVGGRNVWIADGHHDRPLPSVIDDVRIYNHAMTEAEILAAMEGGIKYPYALAPNPKSGALHPDTWVSLDWSPGDFALSHDVYLGDNFDEVNEGIGDTFQGNQTETSFLVGFPGFAFPDGLVPGTTYYWRIDEVNDADPNSPWKGDIWSFSIPPKTAYNPDPSDGAEFVDPNAGFSWTPGFGAKLHTVYMGTDFDDVNTAAGGTPLGSASYSPGTLELEKVYYWRVDEFDALETHKGDIWSFTTPGAVGNPQPANGAVDVQKIATLSWTAADNAASHELYFGTDAEAVMNGTTGSPEYIGPRTLGSESYDPGGF
ncbi:MAG: LamG domain-containing protein, partial [Planctomycetota bacterium]